MIKEFINMYGMEILSTLATALAGYLGVCVKGLYAKYVNTKVKKDVVETCVKAVEQLFIDIEGPEKKATAIKYASEVLAEQGINVGEIELELLIESAVQEFNKNRNKHKSIGFNKEEE